MKALVIGCGRVGSNIALQLDREGWDVTAVDEKEEALGRLGDNWAGGFVLGFQHDLVRLHLRIGDHAAAGQHRGAGHAARGQPFQPFLGGAGAQDILRQREPLIDVLLTQRGRLEARVVQPVRLVQRAGHRRPLAVGLYRGADITGGRLIDQVDETRGILLGELVAHKGLAAHVGGPQEGDDRIQHRQAHVLAFAGSLA